MLDELSFNNAYQQYYNHIVLYLNNKLHNLSLAEDLAQDSFLKLWETRDHYQERNMIKSFIFRIAHNKLVDYYRRKSIIKSVELTDQYVDPSWNEDIRVELLDTIQVINGLDNRNKNIIIRHIFTNDTEEPYIRAHIFRTRRLIKSLV